MAPEAKIPAKTPSSGGYWGTVLTRPVLSWSLYDLANTVFSMNIVSFYLGLWVIDMGGTDATWGYTNSLTMAARLRKRSPSSVLSPTRRAAASRS